MARPRKYPINKLKINEEMLIPWMKERDGSLRLKQDPIHDSIRQDERLYDRKYHKFPTVHGLLVKRVK